MRYQRTYGNIIWTNHAIERLHARKLAQETAFLAFQSPDQRQNGKRPGSFELQKKHGDLTITIIVSQNDKKEWVVISAWVDPPHPGTDDHRKQIYYEKMQKAGFWGRIWLTLRHQLGL